MDHLGQGEPARLSPRKLTIFCFVINKRLPVRKGQGGEEEPEESLQRDSQNQGRKTGRGSAGCREWSVVLASGAKREIRRCCLQVCGHLVQPGLGGALGLKPASSESRGKERQDWPPQEKTPSE